MSDPTNAAFRVAYVYQDEYPWDIRVDKICSSLAESGSETVIVSRNRSGLPRRETLAPRLDVARLPAPNSGLLRTIVNMPAFFSPFWLRHILRSIDDYACNLIIVRDLPLAPTALWAGKRRKVPVVMDMAEDYPAMLEDTRDYRGFTVVDHMIRNPSLLRRIERYVLRRLDAVFTVSDASKRRVVGIGAEESGVHVLENTPRLTAIEHESSEVSRRVSDMDSPRLLYVGGLEETRGLDFVIEAMPPLIERLGKASLTIVGDGTGRRKLEAMVAQAGLQDSVAICGWLDHRYVSAVVNAADVCLVPHRVTAHTNTTLPNKIYDYMAQSRPTVVSHAESLIGMVEKAACGSWYRDGDVDSFVDAVAAISEPDRWEQAGRNGKEAIERELNWETSAAGMIRFLTDQTTGATDAT